MISDWKRRVPMTAVALMLGAGIAAGSAAAEPAAPSVKGKFASKGVTLGAKTAIAFKGKSFLGGDDALIVAVGPK